MSDSKKAWWNSATRVPVLERLEDRIVLDGSEWYDGNYHFVYYDDSHFFCEDTSTGAWYYYDNLGSQTWESYQMWFADSSGALSYNDWEYTLYWWDANHYFAQGHTDGAWYYYDTLGSQMWEWYHQWFTDSNGALSYNDWDLALYWWDANHYFAQSHIDGTWLYYDNLDDHIWEPYQAWFYSNSESHWEFNGWDTHVYWVSNYVYWASHNDYDLVNALYNEADNSLLATWTIYNLGSDNAWSAGELNVVVLDASYYGTGLVEPVAMEHWLAEDAITLEYYFEGAYETGWSTIVDGIGWVSWFYGQDVDNLAVFSHGNEMVMDLGTDVTVYNYTYYYSTFVTLDDYMEDDGNIMFYHCGVGAASSMLSDIASWTNTDVFANVGDQYFWYDGPRNDSEWNHGLAHVLYLDDSGFEYKSDPTEDGWTAYTYLVRPLAYWSY